MRGHFSKRRVRKLGLFGSSCLSFGDSRLTRRGTTHSRDLSGRGAARAEDAQGTPTQSHISSSIQVYEDNSGAEFDDRHGFAKPEDLSMHSLLSSHSFVVSLSIGLPR